MKKKKLGAGGVALAAAVLVLGLASGPASARTQTQSEVQVLRTSPDQPTAGMNNTVWFQLIHDSKPWPIQAIDCRAEIGHKAVLLVEKGIDSDGVTAHCTWFIPKKAKGKSIGGEIAAQSATSGSWYTAGFDRTIG